MANDTIFKRMTREDENAVTELLANLMRKRYVRNIILQKLVPDLSSEVLLKIEASDILSQKTIEQGGRPDLCIENKDVSIIIENKVRNSTSLTENEVTSYVNRVDLSRKKFRKLIYLIPSRYNDKETLTGIANAKSKLVSVVYWENLLAWLESSEIADNSSLIRDGLDYLESVIDLQRADINTQLNIYEVSMLYETDCFFDALVLGAKFIKIITAMDQLLIDDLNKSFGDELFSPSDFQMNEDGVGKYINYKNKTPFYYGFSNMHNDRKATREYGFSVVICLELENVNTDYLEAYYTDNHCYYVPLSRSLLLDENCAVLLKDEIKSIIENALK